MGSPAIYLKPQTTHSKERELTHSTICKVRDLGCVQVHIQYCKVPWASHIGSGCCISKIIFCGCKSSLFLSGLMDPFVSPGPHGFTWNFGWVQKKILRHQDRGRWTLLRRFPAAGAAGAASDAAEVAHTLRVWRPELHFASLCFRHNERGSARRPRGFCGRFVDPMSIKSLGLVGNHHFWRGTPTYVNWG